MKVNWIFILGLAFVFQAFQCDDEDACAPQAFDGYAIKVENNAAQYSINETFYFTGITSSSLVDTCEEAEGLTFINDPLQFYDGYFLVKLMAPTDSQDAINSVAAKQDFDISIELGAPFDTEGCSDNSLVKFAPQLTADEKFYEFRLAVTPKVTGTYAITVGFYGNFSDETDTHQEILTPFAIDGAFKFELCNTIYTRERANHSYFFTVTK